MQKLGNFDASYLRNVRHTKKFTVGKLLRPWTTTWIEQYRLAVHSIGFRLVKVRYMLDTLQF